MKIQFYSNFKVRIQNIRQLDVNHYGKRESVQKSFFISAKNGGKYVFYNGYTYKLNIKTQNTWCLCCTSRCGATMTVFPIFTRKKISYKLAQSCSRRPRPGTNPSNYAETEKSHTIRSYRNSQDNLR